MAVLCALFVAFSCGVAQAEPPKLVTFGQFPAENPLGVAVDQSSGHESSGDVYVASLAGSQGSRAINKFDESGKLLLPSPFGSGSEFYSGAAVNPTNQQLYVLDAAYREEGFGAIDTYDPSTGELLGEPFPLPVPGNGFGGFLTWVQIAADSAGNVYVPQQLKEASPNRVPDDEVHEYSPTGTLLQTFTGSGEHALNGPTGVAVDRSSGDVWVADEGNNRIEEFDPTGGFMAEINSEGVQSVALDGSGDVFALVRNSVDSCGSLKPPCYHVLEYSPAGVPLADIGAGTFGSGIPGSEFFVEQGAIPSLAVNQSSGRVYVADLVDNKVWIYAPPAKPVVGKELAVEVSTTEAKLGALLSPGGLGTSYRFEYDTTPFKEGEASHGQSTPFPEGDAGGGFAPRTVWATAKGLAPGTTYHYRVVARNELGVVYGSDQTFTTETAAQASCPNESLRTGFSASLPDCRAYEQVTVPNQGSASPDPFFGGQLFRGNFAASEGGRLAYVAIDVLPGSQSGGEEYLATRTANGWSSENEIPTQAGYYGFECPIRGTAIVGYSVALSKGILMDGGNQTAGEGVFGGGCGGPSPELVSDEPQGVENLFLRDNDSITYQLIDVTPPGVTPNNATFLGGSQDLSRVLFAERARLTPNAPGGVEDLYEWSGGIVRLVTVLPNGAPVAGSLAVIGHPEAHVVSANGSRVFFRANGNLYERENAEQPPSEECADSSKACTIQVDASHTSEGGGAGKFMAASVDGSKVFFLDETKLTADSSAEPGEPDLYQCELPEEAGKSCNLTDLTVTQAGEPANVQGVSGASDDGSYVYFVAKGVLTEEAASDGESASAGQFNLYVSHGGAITFIATLPPESGDPFCVWETCRRVSSNGAFLAFSSSKSLTGYDNADANSGRHDFETFLYDASSNRLLCASCDPSGAPPTGEVVIELGAPRYPPGQPHYLSENGRLFFPTPDALLPRDTNGQQDVYEFEPGGVGSCASVDGCVYLISSGTSSEESGFIDASADGKDVFLRQYQQLLPQDTVEGTRNLVDARVDGGFPASSSPPSCTTADSCRAASAPQPSIFGAPASATASDLGNLAPPVSSSKPKSKSLKCRKGLVKKKVKRIRCVKRPARKARKSAHAKAGR